MSFDMDFDFTTIMDRKGHDALAIDGIGRLPGFAPDPPAEGFDVIPMWVADMNFPTAPSITEAIRTRLDHPAFGYYLTRDEYYDAIIRWHQVRNHVTNLTRENIGYENGVLGGLVSALRAFLKPGDSVLLHSPTYIGFTFSIVGAGFKIITSELEQDEDGVWRMNYADMDIKIKENHIRAVVFCNPHNPSGRVWTQEEMLCALEVYKRNDCIVIVDEIWSDLVLNENHFIPFEGINDDAKNRSIAFYAPSKTFNLSGLVGSYHIIHNKEIQNKVELSGESTHYNNMNVLSMYALIGAYSDTGMQWVDQLNKVLSENMNFAVGFIREHFRGISAPKPEGTYMLFIDCREYCKNSRRTLDEIIKAGWNVGVAWQDGRPFHGDYAIRMNLALPFERVKEAFERLKEHVLTNPGRLWSEFS